MQAKELSVIIMGRNEMFFAKTIENVLENMRGNTEIIAVCDGNWPDPPINDHPRVTVVKNTEAIGQRASMNLGARISQAKYIMKLDAHCAVDEGFDVKLMADCEYDWTVVPQLYNLHAFDWQCLNCGNRTYQGKEPVVCDKCKSAGGFEIITVWQPRWDRLSVSWRFDRNLQFQYWRKHRARPEAQGEIIDTMSFLGAYWFMNRERFWDLGGMDENHGSWGQVGTEMACKAWLSGGRLVTTKKTWVGHMFRTNNFGGWPYPITQEQIDLARQYSQDLWLNDKWDKAVKPLQWLVDRFAPVPDWHEHSSSPRRNRRLMEQRK
jgi:hypothetical protein